jgi:hypothetical protein
MAKCHDCPPPNNSLNPTRATLPLIIVVWFLEPVFYSRRGRVNSGVVPLHIRTEARLNGLEREVYDES